MQLSIELFVNAPEISIEFYRRTLGFEVSGEASSGYTKLVKGDAVISLNNRNALSADHPLNNRPNERSGIGVEIVLNTADIDAAYTIAQNSGWPTSELALRPWGLYDFRLADPDGYYLRVTSLRG
jgi:uncharacterized glyoxalase superfamily protein PhnB